MKPDIHGVKGGLSFDFPASSRRPNLFKNMLTENQTREQRVVPWQGAASAQPLILYVASENILGPLEEHRERHS